MSVCLYAHCLTCLYIFVFAQGPGTETAASFRNVVLGVFIKNQKSHNDDCIIIVINKDDDDCIRISINKDIDDCIRISVNKDDDDCITIIMNKDADGCIRIVTSKDNDDGIINILVNNDREQYPC